MSHPDFSHFHHFLREESLKLKLFCSYFVPDCTSLNSMKEMFTLHKTEMNASLNLLFVTP